MVGRFGPSAPLNHFGFAESGNRLSNCHYHLFGTDGFSDQIVLPPDKRSKPYVAPWHFTLGIDFPAQRTMIEIPK
jgi:hypothetical protein